MLRAIAVATDTSDVVGTVDLACEEGGLLLHFVRASAHVSEYVPAVPTRGQRLLVPYQAITAVHDDGEVLRLSLSAARMPHRRLVLTHFTRDLRDDASRVHRRRLRAQAIVAAVSATVAGMLGAAARWMPGGPGVVTAGLGAFASVGAGVWFAQQVGRQVMLGGVETVAERRAFFHELTRRLAPHQALVSDGAAATLGPAAASAAAGGPSLSGGSGQSSGDDGERGLLGELGPTLGAVGVAAAVALVAVMSGRSVVGGDEARAPAGGPGPSAVQAAITPSASAAVVEPEPPMGLCQCQGPSSPFLPRRVARLTVLPRVVRSRPDPRKPSLSLEVAVVNNAAEAIDEVKGDVEFILPGANGGERVRGDSGFYYENLRGGRAVKWHLTGRGTSFRVKTNHDELLDESALAPADAFAELLSAQTRSVRVHGAMMLARMRDERASRAVAGLREGASDDELPRLDALARAAAPVYVCDIEPVREGPSLALAACVMNTTDEEVGPLSVRAQVMARNDQAQPADPVPPASVRRQVRVPARTGVRVQGSVDVSAWATDTALQVELMLDP